MGYQVEFFSSPPPQIGQLYTFGGSNLYQIRKNKYSRFGIQKLW